MPDKPILILPTPGEPGRRKKKHSGGGRPHLPTRERQALRLGSRFSSLEQTLAAREARVRTEATGLTPEEVIVLETAGPVDAFIVAVRNVEGLEWLGEVEEEDIPPDDDFFLVDKHGARREGKPLRGRVFLLFTNQQALQQLLSLWNRWKDGLPLPHGFAKWGDVFAQLRGVRPWGVQDRLLETGVLHDWEERVAHNQEVVPCEIELWFRQDPRRRLVARDRVTRLVGELGGAVIQEATIDDVAYHAMLVRLPIAAVQPVLAAGHDASLIQCEQIQFFRAAGQMGGIVIENPRVVDEPQAPVEAPLGDPVVALLDGLPLQNHQRLAGRLVIDDPDGYEARYPAGERRHGTAMASLILHGDLDANDTPLARRLYVRPILSPDPHAWHAPRPEVVAEDILVVDLLHRAVRRLFEAEGAQPAVAPQVCVVNLSIGIRDRLFDGAMSPLARLLDWLAWKYRVLFVVSAGNHSHDIELSVPMIAARAMTPEDLQAEVLRAVAADARNRRLLSPAESVNALTFGAIHGDSSTGPAVAGSLLPFVAQSLPSLINAQGMGYRRAIKPDALMSGGRVLLRESLQQTGGARFEVLQHSHPPGHRVAAPGPRPGDVNHSWHTRGTSNAAALSSRLASELYDVLEELRDQPGGDVVDGIPRAVWIKTLIVHGAQWGESGRVLEEILRNQGNSRQFKEYITRILGYGGCHASRIRECTECRVTALGGGLVQADQAHVHRFPLPPSLSGQAGWRCLTVTLGWLTPVNTSHQGWRRADLWFTPPREALGLDRQEADWRAVQRGTVQHEIMDGDRATAFVDGDHLEILVSCRADAGALEDPVPYAVAVTLEVAEEIGVPIYDEVRARVQARTRIRPQP